MSDGVIGAAAPTRGLRVAILGTRGIPARYGGFETFAEQLALGLAARGHQLTVYAEADERRCIDTFHHGVRVRHQYLPSLGPASVIAYDCACLWDARRGYDLVYMLGYGAAWACWLPRVFGTPAWINVDGLEWARSKWSALARTYLRCMEWVSSWAATRVIADAEAIAQRYRAIYPKGAQCSHIAYGAPLVDEGSVGAEPLSAWGLQPHQYALVVARPEPENHVLEIVQGYLLHGGDWPLVVVGDVTTATAYQRQLLSLASEQVRFVGGVYDAKVLTSLRVHAACYLHGHSVGGTNPSLLEALACGNLIIAHDNPFNREVMGDVAEYFKSPAQMAACVARMRSWSSEACRQRILRARQIVAERYTWNGIIDAYEALMLAECGVHGLSEATQ